MIKTFAGNYFEDFEPGQVITHGTPRTITSGDASLYIALTGSRFCLNCAEPVAKSVGFDTMPLDNLLVFHIAFGKTVPDISLNAVANLGYAEVKFLQPVFANDSLFVHSTVIGLKENSNGKSGIVWVHSCAKNQDGTMVLEWKRWVMVHKKNSAIPAELNATPDLPSFVDAEHLPVPDALNFNHFNTADSGSLHRWGDYDIGEHINHVDGITIDETDHTLATKLYQNNAKVHFNAFEMARSPMGKRLMYGGHVISVCRALSHNGLANAVYISAINGGSHCNPTFAGDTLYCQSTIIDKWEVLSRPGVGALRIRMIGIKNCRVEDLTNINTEKNGKSIYDPAVVLDLDYTVLIPI